MRLGWGAESWFIRKNTSGIFFYCTLMWQNLFLPHLLYTRYYCPAGEHCHRLQIIKIKLSLLLWKLITLLLSLNRSVCSVLDEGLTGRSVGGQYTAVGFCGRYSRNVTATEPQLVAFHCQHVPHGRASTWWEEWGGGLGHGRCGGWAGSDRGHGVDFNWLGTLSDQPAFWEGRLTSSPLLWNRKQQQQERNSRGLGAFLHILR